MNERDCKKLNFIKNFYFQVFFSTRRRIKVSTVKYMDLAKQEVCWWQKADLTTCKQLHTGHWYNIYIYNNRLKRLNGLANRPQIVFDWNATSKISTMWKVSKYGVFSSPYSVQIQGNMDQKNLCIWILFTQRNDLEDNLECISVHLGDKSSFKMRGILEIGVFVAIANDLILILWWKGL